MREKFWVQTERNLNPKKGPMSSKSAGLCNYTTYKLNFAYIWTINFKIKSQGTFSFGIAIGFFQKSAFEKKKTYKSIFKQNSQPFLNTDDMPTPRPPPAENYVDSSRSMLSEFRRKHKDDRKCWFSSSITIFRILFCVRICVIFAFDVVCFSYSF